MIIAQREGKYDGAVIAATHHRPTDMRMQAKLPWTSKPRLSYRFCFLATLGSQRIVEDTTKDTTSTKELV
ncbi:MAG: hypothetical protein KDA60_10410, partial [Planctomycetales bacterium]|nr:hypothetical protein [Planctomycetales bacterium]